MPFGVTVAGFATSTSNDNGTILTYPKGIALSNDGSLYVTDGTNSITRFASNNRTGQKIMTYTSNPALISLTETPFKLYASIPLYAVVYMWPSNATIPPNPYSAACSMDLLYYTIGVAVDLSGNVYIASTLCNWVTRWATNATNGTLVAGSASAASGNDNQSLNWPFGLFLDELNSSLYVADYSNHRIQKFALGGVGTGVTVAGGNGPGLAANQLQNPTSVIVSRVDGAVYVADRNNNRIQKWLVNATLGVTVAGSPIGTPGSTPYLFNWTFDLKFGHTEENLYVSDYRNGRIQRFRLA